jgi:hypothetical protein
MILNERIATSQSLLKYTTDCLRLKSAKGMKVWLGLFERLNIPPRPTAPKQCSYPVFLPTTKPMPPLEAPALVIT